MQENGTIAANKLTRTNQTKKIFKKILKSKTLYLLLIPALTYIAIFNYAPMFGLQMAFRDYVPSKGIMGSQWAGFKYFEKFFGSYHFWSLLKNTLLLSVYQLLAGFPFPVLLALVLHYTPFYRLKKVTQTVTYAPHFISLVVLAGMMFIFLAPTSGIVNIVIKQMGGKSIDFLGDPGMFRHLYVWSGIWQNTGWSSIIYIATLAGVSPELHEASIMDGATKLKRIWYIDIPSILPTAIILLILNTGKLMDVGFEKVFLMQTAPNLSASEIISTYVYKIGIQGAQYSYASAIGLFNNVVDFILLITVNRISSKTSSIGLW